MKRTLPGLITLALSLALAACQQQTADPPRLLTPDGPDLRPADATADTTPGAGTAAAPADAKDEPVHDQHLHDFLADHYDLSDISYVRISYRIFPQTGGVVEGTCPQWFKDCHFRIEIPPRAIAGTEPVEISIDVPVQSAGDGSTEGPPAVFRFEPDGLQFAVPVRVLLCYPPWLPIRGGVFDLYYIDMTDTAEPHYVFGLCDQYVVGDGGLPDGALLDPRPPAFSYNGQMSMVRPPYFVSWETYAAACTGLSFFIDHFSRWETVNGGGDGKRGWPWEERQGTCLPSAPASLPPAKAGR